MKSFKTFGVKNKLCFESFPGAILEDNTYLSKTRNLLTNQSIVANLIG